MSEILICECNSTCHQMVISKDFDDDVKEPIVYAHIHLINRSFWGRLKYGIKYIFGFKCNYGAWDEFIFNPKDAGKLHDLASHLELSGINNEQ